MSPGALELRAPPEGRTLAPVSETPSFLGKSFHPLGREVHRVGLALNYGIDEAGLYAAAERGLESVFYTRTTTGTSSLRCAIGSREIARATSSRRAPVDQLLRRQRRARPRVGAPEARHRVHRRAAGTFP
jgi:hypothetical protein